MPILGITETDAADLIGYLQSETTRLSEAKKNADAAAGVQGHHHHGHEHHKH